MHHKFLRRILPAAMTLPLLLTSCQLFPEEETLPAAPVIHAYEAQDYTMSPVIRGELILSETAKCSYVPAKKAELSFALSGEFIDKVYVEKGDQVKAGDLLAELALNDLPNQIAQQEYQLELLNVKMEHLLENWELEFQYEDTLAVGEEKREMTDQMFQNQLESLEDSIYLQELRIEQLKTDLKNRQIFAPIDGTVTYVRKTSEGDRSQKHDVFVTVADMTMTAFAVTGKYAPYFPVGTQAVVTCNKQDYPVEAVDASEFGFPQSDDNPTAYLRLLEPDPTLEDKRQGTVNVVMDAREDTLYVAENAVYQSGDQYFVYVLNENDIKVMQNVTIGLQTRKYIEIVSGLNEGDSVIVD